MIPILVPILVGAVAVAARAAAAHIEEQERAERQRLRKAAKRRARKKLLEARERWTQVAVEEAKQCERAAADPRVAPDVARELSDMARELRRRA